ncbi:MAG: hypothetical protein ACXVXP_08330 [Mycobacteriaceae bacterium]
MSEFTDKAKAEAKVLYAEVVEELATLEGQDMMGPSDPEPQEKEEPKPEEPTDGSR